MSKTYIFAGTLLLEKCQKYFPNISHVVNAIPQ